MSDKKIGWVKTAGCLTVVIDGKPYTVLSGTARYKKACSLASRGKTKELVEFIMPEASISAHTKGDFKVQGETIVDTRTNEVVPEPIAHKVVEFSSLKYPYSYLKKFWENVKMNPNRDSADQLFKYLEVNNFPITPDGCFLAYKYVAEVDGKLIDSYSKSYDNSVGKVVAMDRTLCDSNRDVTCSHGLHVAAHSYAKECGSGQVIIEVKVNPKDVVSVPSDYGNRKMRVCRYEILRRGEAEVQASYTRAIKPPAEKAVDSDTEKTLDKMSAREIVAYVRQKTGEKIKVSLKSKRSVIKRALEAMGRTDRKVTKDTISLEGLSGREIIDLVRAQTGERIKVSPKSKASVERHAIRILNGHGLNIN